MLQLTILQFVVVGVVLTAIIASMTALIVTGHAPDTLAGQLAAVLLSILSSVGLLISHLATQTTTTITTTATTATTKDPS